MLNTGCPGNTSSPPPLDSSPFFFGHSSEKQFIQADVTLRPWLPCLSALPQLKFSVLHTASAVSLKMNNCSQITPDHKMI